MTRAPLVIINDPSPSNIPATQYKSSVVNILETEFVKNIAAVLVVERPALIIMLLHSLDLLVLQLLQLILLLRGEGSGHRLPTEGEGDALTGCVGYEVLAVHDGDEGCREVEVCGEELGQNSSVTYSQVSLDCRSRKIEYISSPLPQIEGLILIPARQTIGSLRHLREGIVRVGGPLVQHEGHEHITGERVIGAGAKWIPQRHTIKVTAVVEIGLNGRVGDAHAHRWRVERWKRVEDVIVIEQGRRPHVAELAIEFADGSVEIVQ